MVHCYICGKGLNEPSKCILCEEYVCRTHSRSFDVGNEKSNGYEKRVYAHICDRCMEAVEELKRKPREEWNEEDKTKSKGMIGKILNALGKAGLAIVTAIFAFTFWLFTKGENKSGESEQAHIAQDNVTMEESPSESIGETFFAERPTFKEDEPSVAV